MGTITVFKMVCLPTSVMQILKAAKLTTTSGYQNKLNKSTQVKSVYWPGLSSVFLAISNVYQLHLPMTCLR